MWPSATAFATATIAVGAFADGLALLLEAGGSRDAERLDRLGLRETDGLHPGGLGAPGELHVGRLTLALGAPGLRLVLS